MEKMDYTFSRLASRVKQAVDNTDLDRIYASFSSIQGPTLVTGCGGSSVTASFVKRVLEEKNSIPCMKTDTRNVLKMNRKGWKNVLVISYSGNNLGVEMAFDNQLKKYLLSVNEKEGTIPVKYGVSEREESYISLSATFIPMAMAFLYYTDGNIDLLNEILDSEFTFTDVGEDYSICEILSGTESETAAALLESTMTEAGLCAPVVHDKYNFCHGRINLNNRLHNKLIWFDNGTELDGVIREKLLPMYDCVTVMEEKYDDGVINDFYLSLKCLWYCRALAEKKGTDLSSIEECPINDDFYRFNGNV